jgi:hypothetical protein
VAAASIILSSVVAIRNAPPLVHADPVFNLIYFRFLPESPQPLAILKQLDLPESSRAYSGVNAYNAQSPMADSSFREDFARRTSFLRIAVLYARNPSLLLRQFELGLHDAAEIRPAYLANYRREDGFPPTSLAHRFDIWSSLRSRLLRIFPLQLVIFYALMGFGSLGCLVFRRWAAQWPAYPLVMLLAAGGAIEFLLGVAFDVLETPRHLFIFHVLTEILILCGAAALLTLVQGESAPTATVKQRSGI